MTLAAGTELGTHQILTSIGVGGMGEVYKAHDTKLRRDVAIKVLPEAFARDADRLSRFRREAQLLASLNHTNIATIYTIEDSNDTTYLVMELVPGDTLAQRIQRQGAVPVEESLTIAKQIAEALEYAHDHGVIHRDLKPANVKLTPEGKVKVLDFGLAKAFAGDASTEDIGSAGGLGKGASGPFSSLREDSGRAPTCPPLSEKRRPSPSCHADAGERASLPASPTVGRSSRRG
jgi:eukaryotic-like serine/threonine-protein kinase